MKVGDLVAMHTRSIAWTFGPGIIVRCIQNEDGDLCGYQVFWSKYGLGRRINAHSLEVINES